MKKSFIHQQKEISFVKTTFTQYLKDKLDIIEVQGPILSKVGDGMQDNLSGIEHPVSVKVLQIPDETYEVVHSLAKWKRHTLARFGFGEGEGRFGHMMALRPDEDSLDAIHSVYVDQWDWEKIITAEDRNMDYLKNTVTRIVESICNALDEVKYQYENLHTELCREITFITSQELEDLYPNLTPKERENAFVKEKKTVFIMQIGDLLKSGERHDGRAPDYDDWKLNGDLLFWHEPLQCALEVSSMGIRVDAKTLDEQLTKAGCDERRNLTFHKMLLNNELPLTIGGGIGQSRICMLLLQKAHVGEVQASIWDEHTLEACEKAGIEIL